MRRIGIMGGTFDPIHIGHLMIAEAVWDEYNLEKVIFIPSANPPHKQQLHTSADHRYAMVTLATASNPHFEVSHIEMDLNSGKPSYTIETLLLLKEQYGEDTQFYFIVGADTLNHLESWHRIDELFNLCIFIATKRPNYVLSAPERIVNNPNVRFLETPELEISSTDIRKRIQKGYSIRYITPEEVHQYIDKEKLYR